MTRFTVTGEMDGSAIAKSMDVALPVGENAEQNQVDTWAEEWDQ